MEGGRPLLRLLLGLLVWKMRYRGKRKGPGIQVAEVRRGRYLWPTGCRREGRVGRCRSVRPEAPAHRQTAASAERSGSRARSRLGPRVGGGIPVDILASRLSDIICSGTDSRCYLCHRRPLRPAVRGPAVFWGRVWRKGRWRHDDRLVRPDCHILFHFWGCKQAGRRWQY